VIHAPVIVQRLLEVQNALKDRISLSDELSGQLEELKSQFSAKEKVAQLKREELEAVNILAIMW